LRALGITLRKVSMEAFMGRFSVRDHSAKFSGRPT
jgi:hypothetical protein